jgi:hypothetical protein
MMAENMQFLMHREFDPEAAWLMILGTVRDDMPWVYELGMRVYEAAHAGGASELRHAMSAFHEALRMSMRGPLGPEFIDPELLMMLDDASRRLMHMGERKPRKARRVEESEQ